MVAALIPARSGSKSIADKNIQSLNGKPMISYSIEHALKSSGIDRVFVDTDSEHYALLAKSFGAEIPYLRPTHLAQDGSLDIEVFQYFLNWFNKNENENIEMVVHLRPTYPIRNPSDIDAAINLMRLNSEWDSLRSVAVAQHSPYKMWIKESNGTLSPLLRLDSISEAYNQPRQNLPDTYQQNACIDIIRPNTILRKGSMTGENIGAYVMSHFYDIDTQEELERASNALSYAGLPKNKTFVFDIDGVLASLTADNDYNTAEPLRDNILLLNRLYDNGNQIILFTARGSMTGTDWRSTTEWQMKKWGVRYHELHLGKPAADFYVDDRFLPLSVFEKWGV